MTLLKASRLAKRSSFWNDSGKVSVLGALRPFVEIASASHAALPG